MVPDEIYASKEFWRAYATFFFTSRNSTPEVQNVATKIVANLRANKLLNDGLNILCLGIGGCVLEYPLIQAFASASPRIGVYGVDKSEFALSVTSQIIANSQWNIESVDKYLSILEIPKQQNRHRNLLFGDLNQPRPWIGKNEISGNGWLHALRRKKWPKQFDMIFLSGCLHHLNWWKTTACAAFDLLKPNGIIMIPRIEGSFKYIDGNFDHRNHDPDPLHVSLSSFWGDPLVAAARRVVGTSQAIEPVEIQEFLSWLFIKGLATPHNSPMTRSSTIARYQTPFQLSSDDDEFSSDAGLAYEFKNLLSHEQMLYLMRNRAFSTLRKISKELGPAVYDRFVDGIREEGTVRYKINTEVIWRVWQKPPNATPRTCALLGKFLGSNDSINQADERLHAEKFENEESLNISSRIFLKPNIGSLEFSSAIRRFVCSGLLSDFCTAGLIGQDLLGRKSLGSTTAFLNPSNAETRKTDIANFLAYTKYWSSRGYSNGETLLAKSIKTFDRPVVLIISRENTKDALPKIELQNRVRPSHLQLHVNLKMDQGRAFGVLRENEWFREIAEEMCTITPLRKRDGASLYETFQFVFEVPNWEKLNQIGSQTLLTARELRIIIDPLDEENRTKNGSRFDAFITPEFVESIYMMGAFSGWDSIGVFPLCYLDPDKQRFVGLDTVYAFYSRGGHAPRHLDMEFFAFEYQKFRTLFDQLCMRRLGELGIHRGVDRAFGAFSHEVSKVASILDSGVLQPIERIFEVTSNEKDRRPSNAWNPSAGRLTPSEEVSKSVSSWSVCPLPESIHWLNNFLFLWSSAPGSVRAALGSASTLQELCSLAIEIATSTVLAGKLKIPEWTLANVLRFGSMQEQWRRDVQNIVLQIVSNRLLNLATNDSEAIISNILRAIVAALANALKNAKEGSQVDFNVSFEKREIVFCITNIYDSPNSTKELKDQGTRAVLAACLTSASVDIESLFFDPIPDIEGSGQGKRWRTAFRVPLRIRPLRGTELVEWLLGESDD